MGQTQILVDEAALETLKKAIGEAGENYKQQLTRLKNLMEEITRGDIQGDLANELLVRFQEKEEIFNNLKNTIDEAEDYMGIKKTGFTTMIGDTTSSMR